MKQNYLKKLMIALLLLCCTAASAADFEVDGIYYKILSEEDKTVEVTSCSIKYRGAVTIPASVTYNGEAYSVKSIGNYAFRRWHGLTSIVIPEGVTNIGEEAFYYCNGLTSIEIPSSVTSIGTGAFSYCTGLTSVVIPSSVTSIGYMAFLDCTGLTSIEIPAGVTSIGNSAFSGCTGLTSINIPAGVTSIGDRAFYYCTGLTSVVIPSSVTSIGEWAFYYCTGLTSINIPAGVTSIGDKAFFSCYGLTSIVVDERNSVYDSRNNCNAIIETASNTLIAGCVNTIIPEGVTSIGEYVFCNCTSLTSVEIPSSVTSIGERAFYNCYRLTSIEIPNSVTSIGEYAFSFCSGLTSIEIPASVTSIGGAAFYWCSGLTSIVVDEGNSVYDSRGNCNAIIETASNTLIAGCKNTIIPEGVTSIGNSAFNSCTGLTSIEIPASVTSIGDEAFYWCSGLTSVTSHIAAENLFVPGYDAFYRIDKDACTLYVPAGAKSTYAATDGWKEFKNIVEMSSDGSDATAVESVENEQQGEAVYYDLSGRRVENPTRGIYIVGGKKVYIK